MLCLDHLLPVSSNVLALFCLFHPNDLFYFYTACMLMSFLKHNQLNIHVVCGVTPWSLVSSYGRFGGSYCLHPQSSS